MFDTLLNKSLWRVLFRDGKGIFYFTTYFFILDKFYITNSPTNYLVFCDLVFCVKVDIF